MATMVAIRQVAKDPIAYGSAVYVDIAYGITVYVD
jgi:hypothetical protein